MSFYYQKMLFDDLLYPFPIPKLQTITIRLFLLTNYELI